VSDSRPDPTRRTLSGVQVSAGVVGIVAVAFVVLLFTSDPYQNPINTQVVGQSVPSVSGESYDGGSFDLDEILASNRVLPVAEQEWVVVNFFASWCVPCITENPELIRFDEQGAACPTRLVGVAINDTRDDVAEFFHERGGDWPVIVGDTNSMIIDFGVTAPPETLIVAPSGLVTSKILGATTYEQLVQSIQC